MKLVFKKLGNSTGLTFPAGFLREHGVSEGQVVDIVTNEDGAIVLRLLGARKRYTAAELNAQCDLSAPMPEDLLDWDMAGPVGTESL